MWVETSIGFNLNLLVLTSFWCAQLNNKNSQNLRFYVSQENWLRFMNMTALREQCRLPKSSQQTPSCIRHWDGHECHVTSNNYELVFIGWDGEISSFVRGLSGIAAKTDRPTVYAWKNRGGKLKEEVLSRLNNSFGLKYSPCLNILRAIFLCINYKVCYLYKKVRLSQWGLVQLIRVSH